jgi:hypothetical protein
MPGVIWTPMVIILMAARLITQLSGMDWGGEKTVYHADFMKK